MPKVDLLICDICKSEQRSDKDVHWNSRFNGPCSLDLKNMPNVQCKSDWESLCTECAREIADAVVAVVKKRQAIAQQAAALEEKEK